MGKTMKIVIPSKGRPALISTHILLEKSGLDYRIFLHDKGDYKYYLLNPTIKKEKLIVTNAPYGISHQRQWILDNYIEKDEWYISLDDKITSFLCVPEPYYKEDSLPTKENKMYKKLFEKNIISARQFYDKCKEMVELGEKIGAYNIGFATTPNYFFRNKKIRHSGYVISNACVRKHVGIDFDLNVKAMDDYSYTAQHLLKFGKVLINNYIYPPAQHYASGGIGTYADRLKRKISDTSYLMEKYPGLFNYKKKAGKPAEAELLIRLNSQKQIDKWRSEMGIIKP
jgi:hypothetical protein